MLAIKLLVVACLSHCAFTTCPYGQKGPSCELCGDNFYSIEGGGSKRCTPCKCSSNHDPFYPGPMCNNATGVCNRCIFHTRGSKCDECDADYFGDAASRSCRRCHCNLCGRESCDSSSGDCRCKMNVTGSLCDSCLPEHYGFNQCQGCKPCECSSVGSLCNDCHPDTGDCKCKAGVTGRACDQCMPTYWNFSPNGCTPCQCPNQRPCDPVTGMCLSCGLREKETPCGCVSCGECVEGLMETAETEIEASLLMGLDLINETALAASISRTLQKFLRNFTDLEETVDIVLDAQNDLKLGPDNEGSSHRELEKLNQKTIGLLDVASILDKDLRNESAVIINMLNVIDQYEDTLKYNLSASLIDHERDLINLQKREQNERMVLIQQLLNEVNLKLANTADVNGTLKHIMAQADATDNRVDKIYGKVIKTLEPAIHVEIAANELARESGYLAKDLLKLLRMGLESNESAINTARSLEFILSTKSEQYERDVPDAARLFNDVKLRVQQAATDLDYVKKVTERIEQLNKRGEESVFELRGNASQFGGWVTELKVTVMNVTKKVDAANQTIQSILKAINANLTFGDVNEMAEDTEQFFSLQDEMFRNVEHAATNASEAASVANKSLSIINSLKGRINDINNQTITLSSQTNFADLGKKSLDRLNQDLGQTGFKKDRVLAGIQMINRTLEEAEQSDYENWAQNVSNLADKVSQKAISTIQDVDTFENDINSTLNRIPDLRELLDETRDNMRKAENAADELPALLKRAKDSQLRSEATSAEVLKEKNNLEVKFAKLNDKLNEIRSAVNMGLWAMKFDGSQKSFSKLRTPSSINRQSLQQDVRVVISGVDSQVKKKGIIMFVGAQDESEKTSSFMCLSLYEEGVKFTFSSDGNSQHLHLSATFSYAEIYTIRVVRSANKLSVFAYKVSPKAATLGSYGDLMAQNSTEVLAKNSAMLMKLDNGTDYFFGGLPSSNKHSQVLPSIEYFSGCVHLFMLDNVVLNMWNYEVASKVSACNPDQKQNPYYQWDDYGFACSWEPDSYVKRSLSMDQVFGGSLRASTQQTVRLTDLKNLLLPKHALPLSFAVLRNKTPKENRLLANNLFEVDFEDAHTLNIATANYSMQRNLNLYDRRRQANSSLSEIQIEFLTQSGNVIFSAEAKLATTYKVRMDRQLWKDSDFSVANLRKYNLDLFVMGLNSEIRILEEIENNRTFESQLSPLGCFRLRNMFASPSTHSEWLDYEKWAHAGIYLYPIMKPSFFTLQFEGTDGSNFAVVNPPEIDTVFLFQIKTKATDGLIFFLMSPDEKSLFAVSLIDGTLEVTERREKAADQIYSLKSKHSVNDNSWHSVAIMKQVQNRQWTMKIDDDEMKSTTIQLKDLNTIQKFSGQVLYVGGAPVESLKNGELLKERLSLKPFVGCVSDVIVQSADAASSETVKEAEKADTSTFFPAFKWDRLAPGSGSKGFTIGCQ